MHRFQDQAFLLKRYAYGESSLVAHLATREHGRVHLLAKGAYRTTSRFFAVLDLFDTLTIEWSGPPRRELKTLHAGSVVRRRRWIAEDLGRYRAGLTMLELADLASRGEHKDRALFELLGRGLDELDEGRADPALALVRFELGFLGGAGLAPALERCAACGGAAPPVVGPSLAGPALAPAGVGSAGTGAAGPELGAAVPGATAIGAASSGAPSGPDRTDPYAARAAFSAGAGGRLCRTCAEEARAAGRRVGTLPVAVLETALDLARGRPEGGRAVGIEALPARGPVRSVERSGKTGTERGPPERYDGPALDPERLDRVRDFVGRFLDYHLETRPRTHRTFLAAPNRNAP